MRLVEVQEDADILLTVLFDPDHGLDERILKEQFNPDHAIYSA